MQIVVNLLGLKENASDSLSYKVKIFILPLGRNYSLTLLITFFIFINVV